MTIRDRLFATVWKRLFVYNILYEDSEVDERFLAIDERSRVLSISGAGCGVAAALAAGPERLDVCDINPHHLSLTALKCAALRHEPSYATFYDLFGRGWRPDAERVVGRLTASLPGWMARYWREHWRRFERSLYAEGLTSRMLGAFRRVSGVDERWLRSVAKLGPEERAKAVDERIAPALRSPIGRAWMSSPGQLFALGVNYQQRDRLLGGGDLAEHVVGHLRELARTDVGTNWFVWYAIAGQFDHERPAAVPPYLRRDRFERAKEGRTRLSFHLRDVTSLLEDAPPASYTHVLLCDATDWLGDRDQRRLARAIARHAAPGAKVLSRSVEGRDAFARAAEDAGLVSLAGESDEMTRLDRTRQYRRVSLREVAVS